LQYARRIEAVANDAIAALAPFGGLEGVELSIGASHTIADYFLPTLLPQLLREWPKLRIHVTSGSTNEVLQSLSLHQIGIALIEAPAHRPDLKIEAFGEDELTLIVRPDHSWAKKPSISAVELVQEPIILREVGSGMRHFVEDYLEQNGILRQQLQTFLDINSTVGIISSVEAGLGIGFVPSLALEKALKLGTVSAIQLENGPILRELSIALLNGPDPKGPAGALLELVRGHCAGKRNPQSTIHVNEKSSRVVVMSNMNSAGHERVAS
jgi:DNA-binding transcriptional LysR family regulator